LLIDPVRYRRSGGYDAQRYWDDRFKRWGPTLRGPGDEGLSESENTAAYAEAEKRLLTLLDRADVELEGARLLEVGTGSGYYTRLFSSYGPERLVGVDITEALFPQLRQELPEVEFRQQDVTRSAVAGDYDAAFLIDVIEHIVSRDDLRSALRNITNALVKEGVFVVGPVRQRTGRHLYYVRWWTEADLLAELPEWERREVEPFRDGDLLVLARRSD
jgi:cyclopropane fatty-acyl-phospholipid synthase-like methyltransferase